MLRVKESPANEIDYFQNLRSIGALEACSRLFSLPQSDRHPAVQALTVHLPKERSIFFAEGREHSILNSELTQKTELTEFFTFNRLNRGTNVRYCDFPEYFLWCRTQRKWKIRKTRTGTIGRIYTVHPSCGDRFYLRLLLHHEFCKGNPIC